METNIILQMIHDLSNIDKVKLFEQINQKYPGIVNFAHLSLSEKRIWGPCHYGGLWREWDDNSDKR